MEINRELFDQQRHPRYGTANPERMRLALWEWMIRGGERSSTRGKGGLDKLDLMMRDGKLKTGYGPYRARDLFNLPLNREEGPIWTFDRMGATRTELPDGRVVCIGGEHEDSYDPDFCIYNDVIVFDRSGEFEIYGYPKQVFPPTDFHTATLAGDRIIIVGCLGYVADRRHGQTPVYALKLPGYCISEVETSGEMPGWIFMHEADFDPRGIITIRGGEVEEEHGGQQRCRRNFEDYALDIRSGRWQRLTNRNWRQFSIYRHDNKLFVLEQRPEPAALLPRSIQHEVVPSEEWNGARFVVAGVPVSITIEVSSIVIIIEGEMTDEFSVNLADEIRANAEAAIKSSCTMEHL